MKASSIFRLCTQVSEFPDDKMYKTKKGELTSSAEERNNVLELILFSITAGTFAMFNVVYWSGGA